MYILKVVLDVFVEPPQGGFHTIMYILKSAEKALQDAMNKKFPYNNVYFKASSSLASGLITPSFPYNNVYFKDAQWF